MYFVFVKYQDSVNKVCSKVVSRYMKLLTSPTILRIYEYTIGCWPAAKESFGKIPLRRTTVQGILYGSGELYDYGQEEKS